jgi:hypothetical protein
VAQIWWLVLLLFLIVAGLITILVTRQGKVETIQEKRASAAEGLAKTRADEKAALEKELAKAREDCEEIDSEHKVLVGITIEKLMRFWAQKERIEEELELAQSRIRILEGANKRLQEELANKP